MRNSSTHNPLHLTWNLRTDWFDGFSRSESPLFFFQGTLSIFKYTSFSHARPITPPHSHHSSQNIQTPFKRGYLNLQTSPEASLAFRGSKHSQGMTGGWLGCLLGGSSQDRPKWIIIMVSCCPLRIGLWDPFQNRLFMVHTWGLILTTDQLTGMILQVGMMSRCSTGLIAGLNKIRETQWLKRA